MFSRLGLKVVFAAVILLGTVGCDAANMFVAKATETPTRTPRPTFTPLAQPTSTFVPLPTTAPTLPPPTTAPTKAAAVRTATRTPTRRPPTATKPAVPPTAIPPTFTPQPVVSTYEFHVNPPRCEHSGKTFIKGTVYLNKDDPTQRYVEAIVVLGAADGSAIWVDPIKTNGEGQYTFILSDTGARPGTWAVWMVDPSMKRKSDIGGPVTTNNLGPDNPSACWAGYIDFWK